MTSASSLSFDSVVFLISFIALLLLVAYEMATAVRFIRELGTVPNTPPSLYRRREELFSSKQVQPAFPSTISNLQP